VKCPATIEFKLETFPEGKIASVIQCQHIHNHDVVISGVLQQLTKVTDDTRAYIETATSYGARPGAIRNKIGATIRPQTLYDIRRRLLKRSTNQVQDLLQEMNSWTLWNCEVCKEPNVLETLNSAPFLSTIHQLCGDVLIIDATACANEFALPVVIAVTVDAEDNTQLMGFAILNSEKAESYQAFFERILQAMKDPPKVVVLDRSRSQFAAADRVFATSAIIFCREHIKRNVAQAFGLGSKTDILFRALFKGTITEEEFWEQLSRIQEESRDSRQLNVLQLLIDQKGHWVPSKTQCLDHFGNLTTNRAEGFFGSVKTLLDHQIDSLVNVARAFKIEGEMKLSELLQRKPAPSDMDELLTPADQRTLSVHALDMVRTEWESVKDLQPGTVYAEGECSSPDCLAARLQKIPCRHSIARKMGSPTRPILELRDFPLHWQWSPLKPGSPSTQISVKARTNTQGDAQWRYANDLAFFEEVLTLAERNALVREGVDECMARLASLLPEPAVMHEPARPGNKGAPKRFPSKSVQQAKAPEQRRCGNCKEPGHNRRTCPKLTQ
jgi:hypothetical protein